MQVAKWGDSLAVRIPDDVVRTLNLKEGDEVDLHRIARDASTAIVDDVEEERVLIGIRRLSRPPPPGYRFDRDEANAR